MKIILISLVILFTICSRSWADDSLVDLALYCELKHYAFCNPNEKRQSCEARGTELPETRGDLEYHKGTLIIKNKEEGFEYSSELISIVNNVKFFLFKELEVTDSQYIIRGSMYSRRGPNPKNTTYFTINRYTGELFVRTDPDNSEAYFSYTYDCKRIEKKF